MEKQYIKVDGMYRSIPSRWKPYFSRGVKMVAGAVVFIGFVIIWAYAFTFALVGE